MSKGTLLLGLDTATAVTTVGLVEAEISRGVTRPLAAASHRDARRHGEVLPRLIVAVLAEAGCDVDQLGGIAVGVGPGAYTGLRVGIATAEALGFSLGLPVYGAVTVDAIAFGTGRAAPFAVVTDARRREVYLARYADHRTREAGPQVARPGEVAAALASTPVVVTADTPQLAGVEVTTVEGPSGLEVCAVVADRLHRGEQPRDTRPMYLRRPDVTPLAHPKSVLR
jgi:tRNA threonylcarbamoyl adenosine modification protein YeaZ